MTIALPTTPGEAIRILAKIGLPTQDVGLIRQIAAGEGSAFKAALGHADNPQSPTNARAIDFLKAVLAAYSPQTATVFAGLGLKPVLPQQLIPLLRQEGGKALHQAISALVANPSDDQASRFLMAQIAHLDLASAGTGSPKPEQRTHHSQPPEPTTQANRVPEPSPRDWKRNSQQVHATSGGDDSSGKKEFVSAHLYGRKASFCFSKSETLSGNFPTINIDAANAIPNREKEYDWKNKIVFQLTVGELPLVYGVLMGFLSDVRLAGHGAANNKSFSIADQGKQYYLTMQMGKEQGMAMPAYGKDTFRILMMLKEQMNLNAPSLSQAEVHQFAKRVCEKYLMEVQQKAA